MICQMFSKQWRDKNQKLADAQNPFRQVKEGLKSWFHRKIARVAKPIGRYPKRKNDCAPPTLPTQQRQKKAVSKNLDCSKF